MTWFDVEQINPEKIHAKILKGMYVAHVHRFANVRFLTVFFGFFSLFLSANDSNSHENYGSDRICWFIVWNRQLENWNCCTKQTQHKKKTNRTNEKKCTCRLYQCWLTTDMEWNERIIWALDRMLLLLLLLRLRLNAAYVCIVQRSLSTFAAIAAYSSSVFLVKCVCEYGMRMSSSVQFVPMFVAFVVCFRLLL